MDLYPEDLKYSKTHQWAKLEADGSVRVGITDFAQQELGDLVYVELPEVGRKLQAQEQCATVESVKTASEVFCPIGGEVIAVNDSLRDNPEQVNDAPYAAWLFCVRADDVSELDALLDAKAYAASV